MTLTFDPEDHSYRVDGRSIPSVTTMLKDSGIVDTTFYTDTGCANGSRRHKLTEIFDRDELDWDSVADEDLPYLSAWIEAKGDIGFEITEIEKPMYHEQYLYAGTMDRLAMIDGELWVLDLKTGTKARWNRLQMILYGLMVASHTDGGKKPKLGLINLKGNGRYEFTEVDYRDQNTAIATVLIAKWKLEK